MNRRRKEEQRVNEFVDALVTDRRPPRFEATDDEAEAIKAAVTLRSGADVAPTAAYVDGLARRLRAASDTGAAQPPDMGRRGFLLAAGVAAAAAAGGAMVDRLLTQRAATTVPDATPDELVPQNARWTPVAKLSDLPVGKPVRFSAGALEGFVISRGATVEAVSAICTHMGCVLRANQLKLDCPCHGASFSLTGQVISSEYQLAPLPSIRARINGDTVEVMTT